MICTEMPYTRRCQGFRHASEKGFLPEISKFAIPKALKSRADELYRMHSKGVILKKNNRKTMICACVILAYLEKDRVILQKILGDMLNMPKSATVKGYCKAADIYGGVLPISQERVIYEMLHRLGKVFYYEECCAYYDTVKFSDRVLISSQPRIALAIIFIVCSLHKDNIDRDAACALLTYSKKSTISTIMTELRKAH